MEDDIIQVLGRELDFVLSIGDKEKEFSSLEATFQTQVLAVVAETEFDYPKLGLKRALTVIVSKLKEFQRLTWILQQQPAYLLRLLGAVNRPWQLEAAVELTQQIYNEIEDDRVRHLFTALLRCLAKQETERAENLFTCFDP
ncbi:regulator of chromosome condensation repeat-containing protein, partial [Cystoisospora suis]